MSPFWIWSLIIGIILFIVLIVVEFMYLSNHFKAKRARQDLAKRQFIHAWLGRSGTGYVGVSQKAVTVFKTLEHQQRFPLKDLFVFTQKGRRLDFNTTYGPLTPQQQVWGVILKKDDFRACTQWLTEHGVLMTPMSKLMADVKQVMAEHQEGTNSGR